MQPILHLSIPVRDLEEARAFYVDVLGCEAARARLGYQDFWFYGLQLTPVSYTHLDVYKRQALGKAPSYVQHAWVWKIPAGGPSSPPVVGAPLQQCRASSAGPVAGRQALHMADCVLARSASQ